MRKCLCPAIVASAWLWIAAEPAAAGDAFFRGGIIFHPRTTDLADRWFVSFGSDYAMNLNETAFLGFEFQTAFYREPIAQTITATVVPGNGFVNIKYKSPSFNLRPYGGGGLGLVSNFIFADGNNRWDRNTAFHVMAGLELGRMSFEFLIQRNFESGSDTMLSLLFGLVW